MPQRVTRAGRAAEAAVLRQHRRVLIDLAHYAAESSELHPFADDAALRVSTALEIDHVKLLRYRREHNDLFMEAGVGWRPGVVGAATFGTDLSSPVGRAFQTGTPVLIEDVAKSTDFRPSEVLRSHGIISLLNVPILVEGAAWGVIEVDSSVRRGFSEDTLSFMVATASLMSCVVRQMEAETAAGAAAARAGQEVRKRELAIRELQHRVKNNFQMLLGMISMRRPAFSDEAGRELLDRISDAIMAMSLVNDQLAPGEAAEVVNLAAYLRALTTAFASSSEHVTLEVKCDEVAVSAEQAAPIGLIVNELITNCLKHAFKGPGGVVRVELYATGERGLATLVVADNGRGIPSGAREGSGTKILHALADQLLGELTLRSSAEGAAFQLRFAPRTH